jgi:tRNA(Arg) A34 adenosine deaminase TadA
MMDTIRFSILLSLLVIGGYANYNAEKNICESRLENMFLKQLKGETTEEHTAFMCKALELHSYDKENKQGVLIVKGGKVVGEGSNTSVSLSDSSTHAAVTAIGEARTNLGTTSLKGCTVYSTVELCSRCVSFLDVADIDKIIYCIPSESEDNAAAGQDERVDETTITGNR